MSTFRNLLIAQANTVYFTVTFDEPGYSAQRIKRGKHAVKPADPVKTGYDFTGWWEKEVLFDFTTPVTGDIVLSAGWTLKQMTVSFDMRAGRSYPTNKSVTAVP